MSNRTLSAEHRLSCACLLSCRCQTQLIINLLRQERWSGARPAPLTASCRITAAVTTLRSSALSLQSLAGPGSGSCSAAKLSCSCHPQGRVERHEAGVCQTVSAGVRHETRETGESRFFKDSLSNLNNAWETWGTLPGAISPGRGYNQEVRRGAFKVQAGGSFWKVSAKLYFPRSG